LKNASQEVANILRLAQNKTIAFESSGRYGVYFDSATSPQSYTLFKGNDYVTREAAEDKIYFLPDTVEFQEINFQGQNETVFDRLTGRVDNWGSVSVALKDDVTNNIYIYLSNLGIVEFTQSAAPEDAERVKDSRHVHIDYNRASINNTGTEYLVITSLGNPVLQIEISQYMIGGQFEWEGTVNIGGQDQELKIHTHWFNDPVNYTQFCVHRDMRFNTAPIELSLTEDLGNFIEYTAHGLTTTETSVYVPESGIEWQ
jgi:hypothetical protein